jgi:hypothetical protein
MMHGAGNATNMIVEAGSGPRRSRTGRMESWVRERFGRPLVTGSSPDHPARSAEATHPVFVHPVEPATPFVLRTLPRRRIGPVPKLAPGKGGTGLGHAPTAGFYSQMYPGFTPLEAGPDTDPRFQLKDKNIPREVGQGHTPGTALQPTYKAAPFRPAEHMFNQNRSSGSWAQAQFPPQLRVLTPSQQPALLWHNASVKRAIPAAQSNAGLYTFGYPTRASVAARLGGGGPVAVLGGNSQ